MLDWAMLLHHKQIIIVTNRLVPMTMGAMLESGGRPGLEYPAFAWLSSTHPSCMVWGRGYAGVQRWAWVRPVLD